MRIRALERTLLTRERLERMLDAKTLDEAMKVLAECGYAEMREPTAAALEESLYAERVKTYALIKSVSPDTGLIDVFRARYDYHNLKVLVKSEATGEDAERLLLDAGRVPVSALCEMYGNQKWALMPGAMGEAAQKARDVLAATADPQRCDFILDKACYKDILAAAQSSRDAFLSGYAALLIDSANLRAAVRWLRQGRDSARLESVLIDGGSVPALSYLGIPASGDGLAGMFRGELERAAELGEQAVKNRREPLTSFEKRVDDSLTLYLRGAKYIPFGPPPLVGFLAAKESEQSAVRAALGGRMAGLSAPMIRERLRECYV
jgi:V/A-type H+-transporting ATPase subunit C